MEKSFSQTATRVIDSSDGKILGLIKENANIKIKVISKSVGLGKTTIIKMVFCL
ncbi:MAG: winged helix-turn-helix transcriptional regulator [Lachnospiraceae bacterium]|nr:winged helix-turn-helix transcriptional regulator [Lachnospiraceae bacterium]